jgi:hypothetical protein
MEDAVTLRGAIIFFLWKKPAEIVCRLQAVFKEAADSKTAVFKSIDRIKDGWQSLEDDPPIFAMQHSFLGI